MEDQLLHRQRNPRFFLNLDIHDQRMMSLIDNGCFIPLIEKDHLGQQVIILDASKINVSKNTTIDPFRVMNLMMAYYIDQEDSQVAGFA